MALQKLKGQPLKLEVAPDDVVIILRAQGGAPEMIGREMKPDKDGRIVVQESFLLGYGLMRLMAGREWRERVVKKARSEIWRAYGQLEDGALGHEVAEGDERSEAKRGGES